MTNPASDPNEPPSYQAALRKYYVYALIDSRRTGEPGQGIFYVGKGTNQRVEAHVKRVTAKRTDFASLAGENEVGDANELIEDEQERSSKERRISEIIESGGQVIERVIARFDTSEEAFAVEAVLIEWVYGREKHGGQLTNIQAGHGSRHVRRQGDLGAVQWLDVQKRFKVESAPGALRYSDAELEKLSRNGVFEAADETVERLRSMIEGSDRMKGLVTIEDPAVVEYGRYLGATVNLGEPDLILRLQFTPVRLVTNLRARFESRKESRAAFTLRMQSVGLKVMGNGRYGWIDGWSGNPVEFDDHEAAFSRIQAAFDLFSAR